MLLEARCSGVISRLSAMIGKSPTQTRALLFPESNGGRWMGEKQAREIELKMGLPALIMDLPIGETLRKEYLGNWRDQDKSIEHQKNEDLHGTGLDDRDAPRQQTFSGPVSANVTPSDIGQRRIPLISHIQAGVFREVIDNHPPGGGDAYLLTSLNLSGYAFALTIKGDSMNPEFREGDQVIIDPDVTALPGDFVVAKNSEEEATFKKYRPRGMIDGKDVFELIPMNEDYPTLRSDQQPIKIIGVMMEHRRQRRR